MSKKSKLAIVIVFFAIGILVGGAFIYYKNNQDGDFVVADEYHGNSRWGISVDEARKNGEALGEKWIDEPKEAGSNVMYIAEAKKYNGNDKLKYRVIYTFNEDKLKAVQLRFTEKDCDIDFDDFHKQAINAFDEKYERAGELDEEESIIWKSEHSVITFIHMSSNITMAYENIEDSIMK